MPPPPISTQITSNCIRVYFLHHSCELYTLKLKLKSPFKRVVSRYLGTGGVGAPSAEI